MKEYTGFAEVYDMFMDNVPYNEWAEYLHGLLKENGVKKGIVCELGCGTGKMTRRLRDFGYDMIGVDMSEDMLRIAIEQEAKAGNTINGVTQNTGSKLKQDKKEILYLVQDMRNFELYGTVSAVVSVCDCMNYITEPEDLLQVFKLANNYLDPGGVFIFDMNTPYYYKKILGEQTICDNREEGSLIWENYYDAETKINEFDITIYIGRNSETYERFEETHYQRAYSIPEVKRLLKKAGLTDIRVYEVLTKNEPDKISERVYFVSKECMKQKKRGNKQ